MSKELLDRFLCYVKKETRSDEKSTTVPSTKSQIKFQEELVEELKALGFSDVKLNYENCFVTASVPANIEKEVPTVGFIAHVDTADFEARNIKPQIYENYDGEKIILNKEQNIVLDPEDFPNLKNYIGQTIITTDGTTLLGADDKAGVASIITALRSLIGNDKIKHGKIRMAFGPDEEIGRGADLFDVDEFGCDFAYTVDGGEVGEFQYECFNAASATITVKGKNVHPGSAKDKMINAIEVGREFMNALPEFMVPERTSGREGFFHITDFTGTVEEAKLSYIIRDFDKQLFEDKKSYVLKIAEEINRRFNEPVVFVNLKQQYFNMIDDIKKDFRCVEVARAAFEELNIKIMEIPIRGGTDGSKISLMGTPTPNIFTGGENFHGRYEFVSLQGMEKAVSVVLKISELVARL